MKGGTRVVNWDKENQDMAGSLQAMLRAAKRAREIARQTGTPLVIWRDGRIVHVSPEVDTVTNPPGRIGT
jgi:hypothetical protein